MNLKIVTLIGAISATLFASGSGEKIFDAKCAMCHIKGMPSDPSALIAPPLNGVMRHVKMSYADQKSATNFIVDYVQNPSKQKAVCMPQKIQRFGLMPSQKGAISVEELKEVAEWMYENYPAQNFRGHGQKMGAMGVKGGANRAAKKFQRIDTNGDGLISQDEFTSFYKSKQMKRKQKSQNCKGSAKTAKNCQGSGSCQGKMKSYKHKRPTFEKLDLNGDGVITKDEMQKLQAKRAEQRAAAGKPVKTRKGNFFARMDANGDGRVTKEEFLAFQEKRRAQKQNR